jgi:pyrroloquinoline quinone biosynthesis protein B
MKLPTLSCCLVALALGSPGPTAAKDAGPPDPQGDADVPRLVVLGSGQDGGVPHAACSCARCERARSEPAFRRRGPSLGLVVPGSKPWMIDASPDFPEQLERLGTGGDGRVDREPLGGLFLTHAHVGHYTGLIHLGREVVGAHGVPVHLTPALARFLQTNAPWDQLVALGNVILRPMGPGETPVPVGDRIRVTPFPVPHRDEYADTVGYRIEGADVTALYVPDTDGWESWSPSLEARLEGVAVALLDGSFYDLDELPGRAIGDVPHPPMAVTMDRLQPRVDGGLRVVFTHLNHTNPAVDPDSEAARACRARGFEVARDGDTFPLAVTRADEPGKATLPPGQTPRRVSWPAPAPSRGASGARGSGP